MELSANGQFVTNGLLTKELVTGQRQDGDSKFTSLAPSSVQVAGDDNSGGGNAISPTYASFGGVVTITPGQNTAEGGENKFANLAINKAGQVTTLSNPPEQVHIGGYDNVLGHNLPQIFIDFQLQQGKVWNGFSYINAKIYTDNPTANVFGYAISEPYWVRSVVAGQEKDILVQLYERRVLTYTPTNADPYKVEMGNIGQHYYKWRYNGSGTPTPTAPATTTSIPATTAAPTPPPTSVATGNFPANGCLPAISTSGDTVQACVSNSSPSQNSNVTVYGRLIVGGKAISGSQMNARWGFKTTTSYCSGTSDGNGIASCTRDISRASHGYTVNINISFSYNGQSYNGSTSFTTQ